MAQPGRDSSISQAALGPRDRAAPNPVDLASVAVAAFPNRVDLRWQGVTDDVNGTGVYQYTVYRGTTGLWGFMAWEDTISDPGVAAGQSYTYRISPSDFHFTQAAWTDVPVTTPPAGSVDPRRVGVRANGAYWGALGEQIDMLSGNVNYTLPVVKAASRNGRSVLFALSYNSQNWRRDNGNVWKLGSDVGYGFGWRLMAGSIVPYWVNPWTVDHWTFTDATGAEYKLDVNNNGVWTSSKDGLYAWYDSGTNRLYFPDGSFWAMGCVSGGTEPDIGTRYPTTLQDANGNQILVTYAQGANSPFAENSSARIKTITDVRAKESLPGVSVPTYTFYYTDGHLTSVRSSLITSDWWKFTYVTSQPLRSPFAGAQSFGTTALLESFWSPQTAGYHTFEYGTNNAAELSRVTLPRGGTLRWAYRDFTYTGSRTLREVETRWLNAGAGELRYDIQRPSGDSTKTVHSQATLLDAGGAAKRVWTFSTSTAPADAWKIGLTTQEKSIKTAGGVTLRQADYTWTQDGAGRPYLLRAQTTLDGVSTKKEQTLDNYGNQTELKIYDYGAATWTRKYTYTHSTFYEYTNRFIFNVLTSAQVDDGAGNVTLAQYQYDLYNAESGGWCQGFGHMTGPEDLRQYDYTTQKWRGNVSVAIGGGVTRCYDYDISGAVARSTDGTTITSTTFERNNAVPNVMTTGSLTTDLDWTDLLGLSQSKGANNETASFTYDSVGRPASSTTPRGAVTTYAYGTGPPYTETATKADGRFVRTTYDGLGRPVKVETANTSGAVKSVVETEYVACACSASGKVYRVSQPYAPGGTKYWTVYTYDALGRTVQVDHPGGSGSTAYLYSANTVTMTDPAGKWKKYWMDAFGNLTRVNEPNPAGGTVDTYYTYNFRNQLTQSSMTRSGTTQLRTWTYNRATGRLTSVTHPETGTTSYTYNGDGTIATKTDAKGQQIAYTYDEYKRVRTAGGVTFTYDTDPFGGGSDYQAGRLSQVEYDNGGGLFTEKYRYDQAGLVVKKRVHLLRSGNKQGDLDVDYTYNVEGQVTSVKYPNGNTYTYGFDAMGRPNKLTPPGASPQDYVKDVLYGPAGEMTQIKVQMDPPQNPWDYYTETRGYNPRLQLNELQVKNHVNAILVHHQYRYSESDPGGQAMVIGQPDSVRRLASAFQTDGTGIAGTMKSQAADGATAQEGRMEPALFDPANFGVIERGIELARLSDPYEVNYLPGPETTSKAARLARTAAESGGEKNFVEETLMSDNFSGGFSGWTVVDDGANNGPSSWSVSSGELRQTSNISGEGSSTYAKPGTYAVKGDAAWTSYKVTAKLQTTTADDDAIGLMFGYQDGGNYYRFSMDYQRSYRWLVKVVNGTWTVLAEDAVQYARGQWHDVEASLSGGVVTVKLNGQQIFSVADSSHTAGKIALYSWANAAAKFDDVVVTSVGGGGGCTYGISPASNAVGAGGGTGSVAVTAGAGCAWTAVSNDGTWLTVTSGASGSGNGTVGYSAAANGGSERQGTITIAGQTFTVTQAGGTLMSDNFSGGFSGWTVVDDGANNGPSSWSVASGELRQTSNISGEGSSTYAKPGTYAVKGDAAWTSYKVTAKLQTTTADDDAIGLMFGYQDGGNYYRFSMDYQRSYRWLVKVVNGTWTVLAEDAVQYARGQWHDVEASLSGGVVTVKLNGQQIFSVADSSHTAGKIALYSWANAAAKFDDVVVTSVGGGGGCTYGISPASNAVGAGGGTGSVAVTAGAGCAWTAVSNNGAWLTVTSGASGSGNGTVGYSAAANGGSERQGTITIAGQTFTLTQAGNWAAAPSGNSGRLWQMEDLVAGEEVTYRYDELGRLTRAETTGPQWGLSFSYDGFGNRLSQAQIKGTVPVVERTVNAANNRLVSQTGIPVAYDANGNLTLTHVAGCATAATLTYDQFNRLTQVTATGCYAESYGYGADGRRVWKKTQVGSTVTETVYVYGVGGERIAAYTPDTSGATLEFTNEKRWVYFGGRVVKGPDGPEFRDRLGSVALRGGTAASYFPYGEERTATAGEKDKFATYFRDGMTGLDYAQQRYYSSTLGRFLTADRITANNAVVLPDNWNKYTYVGGDPVNKTDPAGLCSPEDDPPCFIVEGVALGPDVIGGEPVDPTLISWAPQYTPSNTPPSTSWRMQQRQKARQAEAMERNAFEAFVDAQHNIGAYQNFSDPKCADLLEGLGITSQALLDMVAKLVPVNAATSHTPVTAVSSQPANFPTQTVSQFFQAHPGANSLAGNKTNGVVYIRVGAWLQYSEPGAVAALIHEALHFFPGLDDQRLWKTFVPGQEFDPGNTVNITTNIQTDCLK
ncbi:MAG: hypothetical protein KIT09_22595 [Bryobacteraceae bacterium]|nr:hypothetical protein [Bryobacteraceae bacterium]